MQVVSKTNDLLSDNIENDPGFLMWQTSMCWLRHINKSLRFLA